MQEKNQITKLFSLKVAWILSISDSELIDDVCLTRLVLVLAEVSLEDSAPDGEKKMQFNNPLRISLWHSVIFLFLFLFLKKCDSAL